MQKSTWKQKLVLILPYLCIVIAGVFIVLSTITLPAVLKSSIEDQLKMAPDTYEFWGQSPGQTKSVTKRNFTFFNFTNPREFLYQNQTPVFNAINGFLLQQRFNYTDYKYSDSMDEVFYNDWLHFTQLQGTKDIDMELDVLNVGPLGFWYQLDLVGMPTFALQGFGGLYVELSQTFKTQAIGQGVSSQFLLNYTNWRSVCDNLEISQEQCNNTWDDPQHGLSDQNNFQVWIDFGLYNDDNAQNYLKSYFGFGDLQMQELEKIFNEWGSTVNEIVNNWFCDGASCSSWYLTLLQLSSGDVTANPPSGEAVDSICDTGNVTCIGQPEITKFLHNEFKTNIDDDPKYQTLKFSTQTFFNLFTPYTGTLLNIGNLTNLFETGYKFDASDSLKQRSVLLQEIRKQTHAETKDHAFVIWEWVKYFAREFVVKFSKGGSEKNSGIGGVFSAAFYEAFTKFGDWTMQEYLDILGEEEIPNCQTFVKETISGISQQKARMICLPIMTKESGYSQLFQPCFGSIEQKEKFRSSLNLALTEFAQYCDTQQQSFYTISLSIHKKIFDQYNCNPHKGMKMCSAYELSMKQFINSSVTLNPIQNSIKTYPKSLSGKKWNAQLDQFQYKNFLKQAFRNEMYDNQTFTQKQLVDLLSFDKLFSASMVMELMIQQDPVKFQKLYYWKNMTLLKTFIKFITIEVGFGGLTQKRSPRELLFGYEDPFLQNLRVTDTMMGGDPSINPVIMLNEPNITSQQASMFPQSVYTGYSDIELTRQYHTINGYDYLTYNKTWYDGYTINSEFVSPYRSHVKVNGTDSIQNPPNLDQKSSIYCLITNIYRAAKLDFKEHTEMYGVDLLKFTVSKSFLQSEVQLPYNAVYYQKFEGFHNVTFLGVPLHICKNNFLSCPANWSQLVKVYSEHNQYEIKPSMEDDTVLKVEPNTGALFFATVRLQTNYHFQSDALFGPGDRMIPVTNVIREGEIDKSVVDDLFGDLKTALTLQKVLLILATIMIPLSLAFITYRCYTQARDKKQKQEIQKSLIEKNSLITETNTIIVEEKPSKQLIREETIVETSHEAIKELTREHKVEEEKIQHSRIPEVNTIIMAEDEKSSTQQQSMSVFPNINGTIAE